LSDLLFIVVQLRRMLLLHHSYTMLSIPLADKKNFYLGAKDVSTVFA